MLARRGFRESCAPAVLEQLERDVAELPAEPPPNDVQPTSQKIDAVAWRPTATYAVAREIAGLGPQGIGESCTAQAEREGRSRRSRQPRRLTKKHRKARHGKGSSGSPHVEGNRQRRRIADSPRVAERETWRQRDAYLARLDRDGRKEKRWRERQEERTRHLMPEGTEWERVGWTREAWVMTLWIITDPLGGAARHCLAKYRRRFPVAVGAIIKAALVSEDGQCDKDWSSLRARCICALGLALLCDSQRTRCKGRWRRIVAGILVANMIALLACGLGRKLHKNTLIGVHCAKEDASLHSGLGYLRALEVAEFMYSQQLPAEEVEPWERWTVKRRNRETGAIEEVEQSSNRYRIVTAEPDNGHLDDRVRARLQELAAISSKLASAVVLRSRSPREQQRQLDAIEPAPAPS